MIVQRSANLFSNSKRRIVGSITYNNYLEGWIVLEKDCGEVFLKAAFKSATRNKDRDKGRESRVIVLKLCLYITTETKSSAQRNQPQPDGNCGA